MVDLSVASQSLDYYREDVYWNSFPTAASEINRRLSGDPGRDWVDRFDELTDGRTFERALILNCGNGVFDRLLLNRGTIRSGLGIEFKPDLVEEARQVAAADGLALSYRQMDVNTVAFADEQVDLVVNHAAGHHIRYLDRVLRACCRMLPEDGWLLSWDYVGPHRNQWPWGMWEAAWRLNQSLPSELRNSMGYPHLPTMLAADPTEAVHSELYAETVHRYFAPVEETAIGGALAYLVLTHNDALWGAPQSDRDHWVAEIMAADAAWLADGGETLFSFLTARPTHDVLDDVDQLAAWTSVEDDREARAEASAGEYYEPTPLQEMMLELADVQTASEHRLAQAQQAEAHRDAMQRRYDDLMGRFPIPQIRRLRQLARRGRAGPEG